MSAQNNAEELPRFTSTAKGFSIISHGNGHAGLYRDADDNNPKPTFICSPLMVLGMARDASGQGWATLVEYEDLDGDVKTWLMPRTLLAGDPSELIRRLFDLGLMVSNS